MPRVKRATTEIKPDGGIDTTVISEGESPEEKADKLREQLGGVQPPPEREEKRGRPRGSHKKKEAPEVDPELQKKSEAIARVLMMGLKIVVKRLPNPDPITPDEEEIWQEGVSPVIAKYLPSDWAPEVQALLAAGLILAPRFVVEKKSADLRSMFEKRPSQDAFDHAKKTAAEAVTTEV